MASQTFSVSLLGPNAVITGGAIGAPVTSQGLIAALAATVTASMATLQLDGAAPTEAHVDTVDTDLIALVAGTVVTTATLPAAAGDALIVLNMSTVTTNAQLNKIFAAVADSLRGRLA